MAAIASMIWSYELKYSSTVALSGGVTSRKLSEQLVSASGVASAATIIYLFIDFITVSVFLDLTYLRTSVFLLESDVHAYSECAALRIDAIVDAK